MASDSSLDPYRPPPPEVAYAPPARPSRPGWFVTICVIAIALGATGFVHAIYGVVASAFPQQMESFLTPQGPANGEEFGQAFQDAQAEVARVEQRYAAATIVLSVLRLVLCFCLALGGVWCLGLKGRGRTLLIMTFVAALFFEVGDTVVQTMIAAQIEAPMQNMGRAMGESMPPNGPPPETLGTIMRFVVWGVMCLYYLLQAAKGVYYLVGMLYLRRRSLDLLFGGQLHAASANRAS